MLDATEISMRYNISHDELKYPHTRAVAVHIICVEHAASRQIQYVGRGCTGTSEQYKITEVS